MTQYHGQTKRCRCFCSWWTKKTHKESWAYGATQNEKVLVISLVQVLLLVAKYSKTVFKKKMPSDCQSNQNSQRGTQRNRWRFVEPHGCCGPPNRWAMERRRPRLCQWTMRELSATTISKNTQKDCECIVTSTKFSYKAICKVQLLNHVDQFFAVTTNSMLC